LKIPVAVKLSPFFTAFAHFARQLDGAGADGLVLFNRFYQPDFDLATLAVKTDLKLSSSHEAGPALLWIALLSGWIKRSLAGTSGVETADQVVKYLLVGADTVMTTSALLRHGPAYMEKLVSGLADWLEQNGYPSVAAVRGLKSVKRLDHAGELLRAQYMHLLTEYVPANLVG
jgi:dihydroorotate dehydrogenase (fumarate)